MKLFFSLLLLLPLWSSAQWEGGGHLRTVDELTADGSIVPDRAYPTYDLYERIMYTFARRYPDRCRLEEWGQLPSGRKILALRMATDVRSNRARPRVLCSAAMHGDELAGYWLLLRLAEEMLVNNPSDLLDDIELYINPLANPDGAYHGGNHSLNAARRGNAQGVDLNRNFPDPDDGRYPDGNNHQPETKIFMQVADAKGFDLAINFHGGAELFNYPWDTFRARHPDTEWWRRISRDFARRAQNASGRTGFFKDRFNGVTNGHDWYPIAGSRQDYMNYYHRTREATVEISNSKRFAAAELPLLWSYVRGAMLGFIEEARFGIHGLVTDRVTGQPLQAKITIPGHDRMHSSVFSETVTGDFYRYLASGTYRLLITAPGYRSRSVIVELAEKQPKLIRVALEPELQSAPARRK